MSTHSLDGQIFLACPPCHYSIILWCGMGGKVVQSSAGRAHSWVAFLVVGGFIFRSKMTREPAAKAGALVVGARGAWDGRVVGGSILFRELTPLPTDIEVVVVVRKKIAAVKDSPLIAPDYARLEKRIGAVSDFEKRLGELRELRAKLVDLRGALVESGLPVKQIVEAFALDNNERRLLLKKYRGAGAENAGTGGETETESDSITGEDTAGQGSQSEVDAGENGSAGEHFQQE